MLFSKKKQKALNQTEAKTFANIQKKINLVEGWLSNDQAKILYDLATNIDLEGDIVEVGSFHGKSTICLAYGLMRSKHSNHKVFAIDPHTGGIGYLKEHPETQYELSSLPHFLRNLVKFKMENVVVPVLNKSDDYYKLWNRGKIRLLYVDGWHAYEACYNDIYNWGKLIPEGGAIVVDDYTNSDEVKRATDDAVKELNLKISYVHKPCAVIKV